MIRRIEALRYRALRYISQAVDRFQVLVGPNASGKSSFLDVVAFLGDVLRVGPGKAVLGDLRTGTPQRAPDLKHLIWMGVGNRFELAVELEIPEERRQRLPNGIYASCRYEVAVGTREETWGSSAWNTSVWGGSDEVSLLSETLWLRSQRNESQRTPQENCFPRPNCHPRKLSIGRAEERQPAGGRL